MIKNLVFDLGGVVIPLTPEIAFQRFEALGIKQARQMMGLYGQTDIFLQLENGTIDAKEFQYRLAQLAKKQSGEDNVTVDKFSFKQVQWAWHGYVQNVELKRLNYLLTLRKDYKVFLLSNTNPFVVQLLESYQFSGDGHSIDYYFDKLFYSYKMKDYKPSETIFRKMLCDANIAPEETLFLDDGPKNIATAQKMGIHAILVNENEDWWDKLKEKLKQLNN